MMEHGSYYRVHDLLDCGRARVERWVCRNESRSSQQEQLEVLYMDQAYRRFPRNEDELLALFEHDISRAQQKVIAVPVGDPAERAHAAWNNHHGVASVRPAGERGVHALDVVGLHAGGKLQSAG